MKKSILASFAALFLAAGAARSAELVADGDFEGASAAWTFDAYGSVVLESIYGSFGATDIPAGNHVAAFASGNVGVDSTMTQQINDIAGQSYTLSFDGAALPGPVNNLVSFSIGNLTQSLLTLPGTTDGDPSNWVHFSDTFLGSGADTLSFTVRGFNGDGSDGMLDNISVQGPAPAGGVPEPATWALMIGGFGLAGAALRRRRAAIAA